MKKENNGSAENTAPIESVHQIIGSIVEAEDAAAAMVRDAKSEARERVARAEKEAQQCREQNRKDCVKLTAERRILAEEEAEKAYRQVLTENRKRTDSLLATAKANEAEAIAAILDAIEN